MIARALHIVFLLVFILIVSSCANTRGSSTPDPRQQWESKVIRQQRETEIRLNELEDLLAGIQRDQTFTQDALATLQAKLGKLGQENRADYDQLQQQIKSLQAELETKTGIIMEEISRELARIRRQASKPSRNSGGEYMRGYEHVVQSGETLSTIASKYGASVDAIADANGLTDPNSIRVGQTLFVPAQ